jgi:hypothetical protein
MIHIGLTVAEKAAAIHAYVAAHGVNKVFVLSPEKFAFDCGVPGAEAVEWDEIIMYRTFYPMLQKVDASSLVVVNECLRTQNRHDLTYNCIRHFLNQAGHQLVFNWLPCIDTMDDFMVLFDFDTRSKWKREPFDVDLLAECGAIGVIPRTPVFSLVAVEVDAKTRAAYAAEKAKLFATLGTKDPNTIPRNLYLVSGKARLAQVTDGKWHIGRNNRFKGAAMQTYRETGYPHAPYTVFEMPHNFIDFADFMALSEQTSFDVLSADLPVDAFYFQRFARWADRIENGLASLR